MHSDREVLELAERHGLRLRSESIKRNDSGLSFHVVLADTQDGTSWVLRIPRRQDGWDAAVKEKAILELVGPRLPVATPHWEIFSRELIAYKRLPGAPAGTIDPEAKCYVWEIDAGNVPESYCDSLARVAVQLHQTSHDAARKAGLRVFTPDEVRANLFDRMNKVRATFGVGEQLWKRWQAWIHNDVLWPKHSALVHGDLHAGHTLVNRSGSVTGVIDWTEAHVTDPAEDFTPYLAVFGEKALERFIAAYGAAGGQVWPNMLEHVVELFATHGIKIVEFMEISGTDDLREMALSALEVK